LLYVAHSQWLCAVFARVAYAQVPQARNRNLSFHQPAGGPQRPLGARFDRGEDDELPLAKADASGAVRLSGMDSDNHLRHARFISLRDDKAPQEVAREAAPGTPPKN
jgi:hypothetical protein